MVYRRYCQQHIASSRSFIYVGSIGTTYVDKHGPSGYDILCATFVAYSVTLAFPWVNYIQHIINNTFIFFCKYHILIITSYFIKWPLRNSAKRNSQQSTNRKNEKHAQHQDMELSCSLMMTSM